MDWTRGSTPCSSLYRLCKRLHRPLDFPVNRRSRPVQSRPRSQTACSYTTPSTSSHDTIKHPAFTRAELQRIASLLTPVPPFAPGSFPPHTASYNSPARPSTRGGAANTTTLSTSARSGGPKEAAVIIPLMNINNEAHVLLEVRATSMRTHAGELSFPGGRIDPTDKSIIHAALREAQEELAIPPSHVEVLGALDAPEYSLGNRSRVWAIVAFIHSSPIPISSSANTHATSSHVLSTSTQSLPSFPLATLHPSPDEVASLLPLPLTHLLNPQRHAMHLFRIDARRPYWKIGVGDLVPVPQHPTATASSASTASMTHTASETTRTPIPKPSDLEVWGLTGWFLNCLGWKVGWFDKPEPLADPED